MKRLALLLLLVCLPRIVAAQTTTVSATFQDPTGQILANGTWRAEFYPNPAFSGPYVYQGAPFSSTTSFSGALDGTGSFFTSIPSNNFISPAGSQWKWIICPASNTPCSSGIVSINGTTQIISTNILIPIIKVNAASYTQPSAYSDAEISGAVPGFTYFNLTSNTLRVCSLPLPCTFQPVGSGGGSGAFNPVMVTFSPTPSFVVTGNQNTVFSLFLSGNVTSSTIGGGTNGTIAVFRLTQDATGGRIFTYPANVLAQALVIDTTPNALTTAVFQYNGTNWVPWETTVSRKPFPNDAICYASPNTGNDSNDGLSWGTAKLTVDGCWNSLPSGGGTIYASTGVTACPTAGGGLWIMGSTDPNFASPPTCWVKAKPISIYCAGAGSQAGFGQKSTCLAPWGAQGDTNHPGIWISGTANSIDVEGFQIQYPWAGMKLGICSTGDRTGTCGIQNDTFKDDSFSINQVAGAGPDIDIGSNSFWLRFYSVQGAGNLNATGGITSDAAQFMVINPSTGTGSGLVFVQNSTTGGGGIKLYNGSSGGGLYVDNFQSENNTEAVVWVASATANTLVRVRNLEIADCAVGDCLGVRVDPSTGGSTTQNDAVVVENIAAPLQGPMVCLSGCAITGAQTQVISSTRQSQAGIISGQPQVVGTPSAPGGTAPARLEGVQDETLGRRFSPVAARFAPLLNTGGVSTSIPANWTVFQGTGTVTSVAAPDGTTNAGRVTRSTGTQFNVQACCANVTPTVGQWYIAGVWARSQTANGLVGGVAFQLEFVGDASDHWSSTGGSMVNVSQFIEGDGEWRWYYTAQKVAATDGSSVQFLMALNADATHTIDYYAPIVIQIPAATISDNEALEYALAMRSYDGTAQAGSVSMLPTQNFLFGNYFDLPDISVPPNPPTGKVRIFSTSDTLTCITHTGGNACPSGSGGGATFQVNGTNTSNQTTINFTSGTNISVSNPTAGQVAFNLTGVTFNALSPMTTLGDTIYENATPSGTRLPGNTTTTQMFFSQTGNGTISAAPVWSALASGNIPPINLSISGNGGVTNILPFTSLPSGGGSQVLATPPGGGFGNMALVTLTDDFLPSDIAFTDVANNFSVGPQTFAADTTSHDATVFQAISGQTSFMLNGKNPSGSNIWSIDPAGNAIFLTAATNGLDNGAWQFTSKGIENLACASNSYCLEAANSTTSQKEILPSVLATVGQVKMVTAVTANGSSSDVTTAWTTAPKTIANGTATMTTAAISSGACGTTVTVSASGVLTTDVVNFSNAAAVTANNGVLIIHAWPTANNINVNYCNGTASSVTPTAATLNWQVLR